VKVISNKPGKLRAVEEAGLEIAERVSIEVTSSDRPPGIYKPRKRRRDTYST